MVHFFFDLSQKIYVERRTVTSVPQIFGDLGGLYEFHALIILSLIGRYKSGVFSLHQVT